MRCASTALLLLAYLLIFVGAHKYITTLDQILRQRLSNVGTSDLPHWDGVHSPLYFGDQEGLMAADKIDVLPGQPDGVNFDQYSGYVTVDPGHGRSLFYYFAESPENASSKPLVLWLNGGPGCSSLGAGAMMELGPFRVNSDGKSLSLNKYSWNEVANVIFLESPAGVGFSYSNTTTDYDRSGDQRTASDTYTFLLTWLERFPLYKTRDFFITGESYAGHYVPQLAHLILHNNKNSNQTVINLRGIAIGNALIDDETTYQGQFDFYWTHALYSDETHATIQKYCNFSSISLECEIFLQKALDEIGPIYGYNIYAPFCRSSPSDPFNAESFDPCSENYVYLYLNLPEVQKALHANVTGLPYPWESCNGRLSWGDSPTSLLAIIHGLMKSGISVWIYSGDIDGVIPVTSTKLSINKLNPFEERSWYAWRSSPEIAGYAVGYQNLTFVTVRGAGHFVPSYQPARALTLFSSFVNGTLPPAF